MQSGYRLVIPSVSIGMTAQLAVDLLTESYSFEAPVPMRHMAVLPLVGKQDKSDSLLTEMQAYVCHEHKLVALQIRSGIVRTMRQKFVEDLLAWAQKQKFAELVILTSTDAAFRIDSQLEGSPVRALTTSTDSAALKGLQPLERVEDSSPAGNASDTRSSSNSSSSGVAQRGSQGSDGGEQQQGGEKAEQEELLPDGIFLPSGGYARKLFLAARKAGVTAHLASIFTSPGENTVQAHMLGAFFIHFVAFCVLVCVCVCVCVDVCMCVCVGGCVDVGDAVKL